MMKIEATTDTVTTYRLFVNLSGDEGAGLMDAFEATALEEGEEGGVEVETVACPAARFCACETESPQAHERIKERWTILAAGTGE